MADIALKDIRRGLRVRGDAQTVGVLFQLSGNADDDLDQWYLVCERLKIVCPRCGTREEMVRYARRNGALPQ